MVVFVFGLHVVGVGFVTEVVVVAAVVVPAGAAVVAAGPLAIVTAADCDCYGR